MGPLVGGWVEHKATHPLPSRNRVGAEVGQNPAIASLGPLQGHMCSGGSRNPSSKQ